MSISAPKFDAACEIFDRHWQTLRPDEKWQNLKLIRDPSGSFLRITRTLRHAVPETPREILPVETEVHEDDPEAVIARHDHEHKIEVVYDIIYSSSYQVPALYVTIKDPPVNPANLEEAYDLLVPEQMRSGLRSVGVMGGLSMTEHPRTAAPAYFLHPCLTQEAMSKIAGTDAIAPTRYLMLWIGLIGSSVGLDIPLELVQALIQDES